MDTMSITVRTGSNDFIAIVDSADDRLILPHVWRDRVVFSLFGEHAYFNFPGEVVK